MGLFSKKSPKDKLLKKYKKLTEEAYRLSHTNRSQADALMAQADAVLKEIEMLEKTSKNYDFRDASI